MTISISPVTITWTVVTVDAGTPPGGLKWLMDPKGKTHWYENYGKPLHWDAKDL